MVLPYYPVGTMERTVKEGQVATANTYAQMFSNLPSCGKPTRLLIYDLHTLQNRFYLHGNVIGSLKTTIPLLLPEIKKVRHFDPRASLVPPSRHAPRSPIPIRTNSLRSLKIAQLPYPHDSSLILLLLLTLPPPRPYFALTLPSP